MQEKSGDFWGTRGYNYCGGDPVNRSDPMGLDWIKSGAGGWFEVEPKGTCSYPPSWFDAPMGFRWTAYHEAQQDAGGFSHEDLAFNWTTAHSLNYQPTDEVRSDIALAESVVRARAFGTRYASKRALPLAWATDGEAIWYGYTNNDDPFYHYPGDPDLLKKLRGWEMLLIALRGYQAVSAANAFSFSALGSPSSALRNNPLSFPRNQTSYRVSGGGVAGPLKKTSVPITPEVTEPLKVSDHAVHANC